MSKLSYSKEYPRLDKNLPLVCHSRQLDLFQRLKSIRPDIWNEIVFSASNKYSSVGTPFICVTIYKKNGSELKTSDDFEFTNNQFRTFGNVQCTIDEDYDLCYDNISVYCYGDE